MRILHYLLLFNFIITKNLIILTRRRKWRWSKDWKTRREIKKKMMKKKNEIWLYDFVSFFFKFMYYNPPKKTSEVSLVDDTTETCVFVINKFKKKKQNHNLNLFFKMSSVLGSVTKDCLNLLCKSNKTSITQKSSQPILVKFKLINSHL